MLGLSTKSCSVTIDAVQQKIYFAANRLLFSGGLRVISFEAIEQVYLDYREDSYTIADEYGSVERIKRRWAIELALKDGEIVRVREETTDHPVGETTALAGQHARWETLAKTVGELVGKPLIRMPSIPGGPYTFIQAIEHILQRRISQSGLNNLSVRLRSGKDLGVEIVVNDKLYVAVGEVEDEAVRSLIQASIREWETGNK